MDNPSATPDISIQISESPTPILKYPRWMEISYPEDLAENNLVATLKNYISTTEELAKSTNVRQLKIQTDPTWQTISELGFSKAVYYIETPRDTIASLVTEGKSVETRESASDITSLVREHFDFHHQSKPEYYTENIAERASTFASYAEQMIANEKGFILVALLDNAPIGFLYGETDGGTGTLDEMFVKEEHRDKGFGTALLSSSAPFFKNAGCEKVDAYVCVDIPAVDFYDSRGFKKNSVYWIKNIQ